MAPPDARALPPEAMAAGFVDGNQRAASRGLESGILSAVRWR